MDLAEFAALHTPAPQADEVRFNQLIAAIAAAAEERPADFRHWTLGAPGHCAVQRPGRAILLGNLGEALAERIRHLDNEIAEHDRDLDALTTEHCPQLLAEPGIGSITDALRLDLESVERVGDDVRIRATIPRKER